MTSPIEALAFFDRELARFPRGVDVVRVLLDSRYQTDPIDLSGSDEREVLGRLQYHHLSPQLITSVRDGKVVVSDVVRRSIDALAVGLAMRTLALERLAIVVSEILSSVEIEFLVLKGVATARLDYADPAGRQTSDLDILVRPTQLTPALNALARSGFIRRSDSDLLDKGEAWESPAGVVDLHTRPHTAGRFLDESWWATSDPLVIAGQKFRALPRSGRLAHAASHYSISYPNHRMLTSLLDLLTIARMADEASRAGAERFLSEVGVGDITARITTRAGALIGDECVVLGRRGGRPLDVMLRRAYDRPDLDLPKMKLAKIYGMPWVDKMAAIRGLVAPTEEFLAKGGYLSRTDRFRKLFQRKRTGRSRRDK